MVRYGSKTNYTRRKHIYRENNIDSNIIASEYIIITNHMNVGVF